MHRSYPLSWWPASELPSCPRVTRLSINVGGAVSTANHCTDGTLEAPPGNRWFAHTSALIAARAERAVVPHLQVLALNTIRHALRPRKQSLRQCVTAGGRKNSAWTSRRKRKWLAAPSKAAVVGPVGEGVRTRPKSCFWDR